MMIKSKLKSGLENASKAYEVASDAADAAWDDYENTLNHPNRETWKAARKALDAANDAADIAQKDYSDALCDAAICADKIINKGK